MQDCYVLDVSELQDESRRIVRVGARDIVLMDFQGEVLAFENVCPHMGGPVGEGSLVQKVVGIVDEDGRYVGEDFSADETHLVCPWHGWEYRLPSGECAVAPRSKLRKFPVRVEDGRVLVTLDERDLEPALGMTGADVPTVGETINEPE